MHLNVVVYLLLLSIILTNVVVESIEPITMGIGAAAVAAGYWLFGSNERRDKVAEKVHYCTYYECCDPRQIIYDVDGLKADLQSRLFGQHIVNATLIPALRAHIRNLHRSEKPLVMSFHGLIGTGKNFVTERIIKHFYQKGDHSRFVHKYMARKDFPLASEVDTYRIQLVKEITEAIYKCQQSLFVFDEVEKMPAGVFESIASLLDYHSHVGGVDFRKAIFIFLTNAGGEKIAAKLHDMMENDGIYREKTKLNDFDFIAEVAAYNLDGGLKDASIIKSGLIDVFLPFLPLERRHITECVRAEYKKINHEPHDDDVTDIVEDYVSYDGLFSKFGCKRLSKKVQASVEKQ